MQLTNTDTYLFGYPVNTSVTSTSNVTVNEHRAPTDESIRLLREMEDKVRESLSSGIQFGDNTFEATVYRDLLNNSLVIVFILNGQKCYCSIGTHELIMSKMPPMDLILERVSRIIASSIVGKVLTENFKMIESFLQYK